MLGGGLKVSSLWSPRALVVALWLVYVLVAHRTAWLSDDAMITLRTSANVLAGHGLTWNTDERVQTYTHPLWMGLLTAAHAVTGEPFYSSLYLSWLVSGAAVFLLCVLGPGGAFERALALIVLLMSKAFVDFSSSGLENPLTHLWLAGFVRLYLLPDAPRRTSQLCALAGLGAVIRFDVALLAAPAIAFRLWRVPLKHAVGSALTASLPLLGWAGFGLIYYGFPWPNTAYAKLGVGELITAERWLEGIDYFGASLQADPLTLIAALSIVALVFVRRDRERSALVAGALLYFAYTLRIGGDFMNGRFFSAPLALCVACLATSRELLSPRMRPLALAGALLLPWLGQVPPPFIGSDFGSDYRPAADEQHDERALFFQISSLTHAPRIRPGQPGHPWSQRGERLRAAAAHAPKQRVRVVDAIGYVGYYAGPNVHIVDHWALADPLLARMPALFGKTGHYTRAIPEGYLASLALARNVIVDKSVAHYYSVLSSVVRGPLFSAARMQSIWKLNSGALDAVLERGAYVRGSTLKARIEITNPTDHPIVTVYGWNDWRRSAYVIDSRSERGKRYALTFEIDAAGARLIEGSLSPAASLLADSAAPNRIETIDGLRDGGQFTIAALFESSDRRASAIYELRFHYRLDARGLTLIREPAPFFSVDFPNSDWVNTPVRHALRVRWL